MAYPIELFNDELGCYRVTFSPEEHEMLLRDGYTMERDSSKEYIPYTALPPKTKKAAKSAAVAADPAPATPAKSGK